MENPPSHEMFIQNMPEKYSLIVYLISFQVFTTIWAMFSFKHRQLQYM